MATATQRAEDADKSAGMGEVTLGQKMMSAVSGSILTSLLGVYIPHFLVALVFLKHVMVLFIHGVLSHSSNSMLSPSHDLKY
jgi:hypothetical protein